jgi:hypothetical protein
MKQTTIDASLLPNVWLQWETTKGKFFLNCETGKKQNHAEPWMTYRSNDRSKRLLIKSGSKPRFAYAKYHDDIECLELAEVIIPTTRKEEVHEWQYAGKKYFICKDKKVMDKDGNICTSNFCLDRYHYAANFKSFLSLYYRLWDCNNPIEEFKKFLGRNSYTVGSGRSVNVTSLWHIQEWYKTKQKVKEKRIICQKMKQKYHEKCM